MQLISEETFLAFRIKQIRTDLIDLIIGDLLKKNTKIFLYIFLFNLIVIQIEPPSCQTKFDQLYYS